MKKIVETSETKQEDVKPDVEESNRKEYNDRKRKRSPSPVETSPVPQKAEDEPDLDESVIMLSWCKYLFLNILVYTLKSVSFRATII